MHTPRLPALARRHRPRALLLALLAAAAPALAQEGPPAQVATVCVACHGLDGNSAIPMFPRLAGQSETYLIKQLRDFQAGRRKSDVMAPVVATLTLEDIAALAAWYARQAPPGVPAAAEKKRAAFGKLLYLDGNEESGVPACVGCHKPAGEGHLVYPRLAGQHVPYLTQQLKSFSSGDRSNDVARYMRVIAKRMSEEEMQAVAEYLAGLSR